MPSLTRHIKLAPVLLLALLAIGTSVQIGCGGSIAGTGTRSDDATGENPFAPDDDPTGPGTTPCNPYGYYGCGGYGYGGYGYGGYGR